MITNCHPKNWRVFVRRYCPTDRRNAADSEAAANEIEVTDAEVNQYFDRVAQQNFHGLRTEVENISFRLGASVATLKRQIKGERPGAASFPARASSANVSDDEVNAIIERIKATKALPRTPW